MIKKAYNLKIGDRIGGRTIAVFCSTEVNLGKNKLGLYLTNAVQFQFADKLGSDEFVTLVAETDVWIDDPVPYCKPTTITHKISTNVHPGDVLCFKVDSIESGGRAGHLPEFYFTHISEPVGLPCDEIVTVLEGGEIELI